MGVFLAKQELRVVFDNFDQNKDGNIAYNEFVNVLKVSRLSFESLLWLANLTALCNFETAQVNLTSLSGFCFCMELKSRQARN